jgi:hypothetical protein
MEGAQTRSEEVTVDDVKARQRARRTVLVSIALGLAALCLFAAIVASPAQAASTVTGGTVTLLTYPPQAEGMFAGGIAPLATPPATLRLTGDAWRYGLPVSGGRLDTVTGAGAVSTRGGLVFWGRETMSAWTQLSFTRLVATTGAHAKLTGVDGVHGTRRVLCTLDAAHATVKRSSSGGHAWVTVGGLRARLSAWLKGQLTAAFPSYEPSGDRFGTVTVKARLD